MRQREKLAAMLALFFCAVFSALAEQEKPTPTNPGTNPTRQNPFQGNPAPGQNQRAPRQEGPSLEEKVSILEETLEKLRLQQAVKTYSSVQGMGPAASAVYEGEGLSIGGYLEINGVDSRSRYKKGAADVERFVLYTGYRFNKWIVFNAELEYEHAGFERTDVVSDVDFAGRSSSKSTIEKAEAGVEFAYLDFLFSAAFQLRTGLNLVPIGITNYMHEPTTFYSVNRPTVETTIIPSTWRELGILAHGELLDGRILYRTGVLTGLDATRFTAADWIGEDGSFRGSQATLRDLAFIANVDAKPIEGLTLGGSYYRGRAGQGNVTLVRDQERINTPSLDTFVGTDGAADILARQRNNQPLSPVTVNISEAHGLFRTGPWDFRGLFVRGWMDSDDSRSVNRATGENVGRVAEGGYLEAAFNVLSFFDTDQKLMVFVRDERLNTQRDTSRRNAGGKDDLLDAACSGSALCKTTDQMTNGNRDLGYIAASDPVKELYGVTGSADRTNDRRTFTIGMAYFPHPNVVLKLEYAKNSSRSTYFRDTEFVNPDNNKIDQIKFGMGLIF